MRKRKDRRKPAAATFPFEDIHPGATDRRKLPDRRLENLDADQRQLLFSEMPGQPAGKNTSKD